MIHVVEVAGKEVEVSTGDYLLYVRKRQWNIHRIGNIVYDSYPNWANKLLINDFSYACPERKKTDHHVFLLPKTIDIGSGVEDYHVLMMQNIHGHYRSLEKAEGVAAAMISAQDAYDDGLKNLDEMFYITMNLVRHG